jgi:hypothetical protein
MQAIRAIIHACEELHTWMILIQFSGIVARLEPMETRMPPDWSDGYTSIFEHQE